MKKEYANHREILKQEFQNNIEPFLKNTWGLSVLEIGAGATNAKIWFEMWGCKYVGIDNGSEYMQEGVKVMDAHDMREFADESFDVVYLSHTAEHFIAPHIAFREIFRVLKPGGMVLSITPYPCEHQILYGDGTHISVLNSLQWTRVLMSVGFKIDKIQSYVQMMCKGQMIPLVQDYQVVTVGFK